MTPHGLQFEHRVEGSYLVDRDLRKIEVVGDGIHEGRREVAPIVVLNGPQGAEDRGPLLIRGKALDPEINLCANLCVKRARLALGLNVSCTVSR
jgi:hypothetical protein